ncbi:LLM class F420-dependent oxidoreductase [Streptomyces daliensis]|uniref:LLM class F420-dependent oxidoreductase n=1 Tax=Streptomyces daliensis TaxID=299421 RepID=A0A8T4IWW2_9ACTN|nr:LLM class F420-dependent oxidoreductase [Streptomyces daliensis]
MATNDPKASETSKQNEAARAAGSVQAPGKGLGTVGIWSGAIRTGDSPERDAEIADAVAELDELGYGTIWIGGSPSVGQALPLLAATSRAVIATGILNIWEHPAAEVAAQTVEANAAHDGRFLLGIGVSHSIAVPQYGRPYTAMKEYLAGLDAAATPVPKEQRVLAALGPKMLELSRDRAAGAHPYLVTAEHVAKARATLGEDAALAPELKVVLDDDLPRAREVARAYLDRYLQLPNYTKNLLRLGFEEEDFAGGGSDRLLAAVFALGDAETVRARVDEFHAAGADHVALQTVTANAFTDLPLDQWRLLSDALALT